MVFPQQSVPWCATFQLPGSVLQTRCHSTGTDSHGRMLVPHGLLLLLPLLRLLLCLMEIAQGHVPRLLLPCRPRKHLLQLSSAAAHYQGSPQHFAAGISEHEIAGQLSSPRLVWLDVLRSGPQATHPEAAGAGPAAAAM